MTGLKYDDFDEFEPRWAPQPPGRLLQHDIDAMHLTQSELALRLGVSKKHLNQVVKGSAPLSSDFALALERTTGTSAQLWLRLEADWRASQLQNDARASLSRYAEWLKNFSPDILRARGIADSNDDDITTLEKVLRFFGVNDPDAFDRVFLNPQAKYKRSDAFEIDPYSTALWLRFATTLATDIALSAPEYSAKGLRTAAAQIRAATTQEIGEGFLTMQHALLEAGVILVFVPETPKTRISGVSLWLSSDRPMIALTNRYRFEDAFWFSLAHEIAHVLLHLKRTTFVDVRLEDSSEELHHGDESDEHERAANKFAEQLLLGSVGAERLLSLSSQQQLTELANACGIARGIVAGQYGNATGNWARFGKLRTRASLEAALDLASLK